jgi:hypothetical protein
MPRSQLQLTADLIEAICARIKAGAYEWVAVESLGVPWGVYQSWLDKAKQSGRRTLCQRLAASVMQARAHARLRAEMEVREKDVKAWLLQGPGRETATREGWGPAAKVADAQSADNRTRLSELCSLMLKALAPFPEARGAVVEMLGRQGGLGEGNQRQRVATIGTL